ncbi:hypothetical protein ACFYP4_29690 [Streptomyces sp. NPDC005551]|uniref:hypothetical protein n=1 Tax=unclassified Streptomyces TaxID=2593676 RepID=UPI0033F9476B
MLPADMGGGGVGLKRGLEALKDFKKRVDTLLTEFEGSAASSSKVAAHTIPQHAFSGTGNFPEAAGLYTQYHRVHERLTSLSRTLGLQIEAMGIAVHGADITFDNLEEDLRHRFWAIKAKVDHEHEAAQRAKDGKAQPERNNDKKVDGGWAYDR